MIITIPPTLTQIHSIISKYNALQSSFPTHKIRTRSQKHMLYQQVPKIPMADIPYMEEYWPLHIVQTASQ